MRNGSVLFREPSQSEGGRTFEIAFQDDNSRTANLQRKPLPSGRRIVGELNEQEFIFRNRRLLRQALEIHRVMPVVFIDQ
jgi:hypothetical protein